MLFEEALKIRKLVLYNDAPPKPSAKNIHGDTVGGGLAQTPLVRVTIASSSSLSSSAAAAAPTPPTTSKPSSAASKWGLLRNTVRASAQMSNLTGLRKSLNALEAMYVKQHASWHTQHNARCTCLARAYTHFATSLSTTPNPARTCTHLLSHTPRHRSVALPGDKPDAHANVIATLNNLAGLLEQQGLHARAKLVFVEALDVLDTQGRGSDGDIAAALNNIALVCNALGEVNQAVHFFTEALTRMKKAPPSADMTANIARCLNNLVRCGSL